MNESHVLVLEGTPEHVGLSWLLSPFAKDQECAQVLQDVRAPLRVGAVSSSQKGLVECGLPKLSHACIGSGQNSGLKWDVVTLESKPSHAIG